MKRTPDHDIELWKHHAGFGGDDKNRMVGICTWLLGASALMLWYIFRYHLDTTASISLKDPIRPVLLAALGMIVSFLAMCVALLFGGYANRNWQKADQIAKDRGWLDILHDQEAVASGCGFLAGLNRLALRATRCEPEKKLALIFITYAGGATLLLIVHLVVLVWGTRITFFPVTQ
jgi:hypothetical protein